MRDREILEKEIDEIIKIGSRKRQIEEMPRAERTEEDRQEYKKLVAEIGSCVQKLKKNGWKNVEILEYTFLQRR